MKPETTTLAIGILSFAAFLLSNLFPHLLPSIGKFLKAASLSTWVILFLVLVNLILSALLLQKRKSNGKTSRL